MQGGWVNVLHTYPSAMAQNFWTAIWAFATCLLLTVAVSLVTRPRQESDLRGLVYSLTPKAIDNESRWYMRPVTLAWIVIAAVVALNLIFR